MSPAIQIEQLTKDFHLGIRGLKLRAVEDLTLTVADNEIFGLLGPNGSGKSTTIKALLGLLKPTRGTCRIFGKDSAALASRAQVGFLPEAPYFYRYLSGRELVNFYAKIAGLKGAQLKESVDETVELVGLKDAARRRVGTYSKGMLQRIGLAQAIVHDPQLVILDEPTAGVDPIGAAEIAQLIRKLKTRGKTVLLCTHLLAQVEDICDRVAILNRGKLVLEGRVDELLQHNGQQSLIIEGYSEALLEPLKELLARHGATLSSITAPRQRLDELFMEQIQGKATASINKADVGGGAA